MNKISRPRHHSPLQQAFEALKVRKLIFRAALLLHLLELLLHSMQGPLGLALDGLAICGDDSSHNGRPEVEAGLQSLSADATADGREDDGVGRKVMDMRVQESLGDNLHPSYFGLARHDSGGPCVKTSVFSDEQ